MIKIGDIFGCWTVIQIEGGPKYKVKCRCSCGVEKWVNCSTLRLGKSKSCGRHQKLKHKDYGIRPGDKFGYWTVIRRQPSAKKPSMYLCRCICGKERVVWALMLIQGRSQSCGCRRAEGFTQEQLNGKDKGQRIMRKIHEAKLAPAYFIKSANKNSKTGIRGVCLFRGGPKYRATIMVDHKSIALGIYDRLDDAVKARKAAEEKYFTERAKRVKDIIDKMK